MKNLAWMRYWKIFFMPFFAHSRKPFTKIRRKIFVIIIRDISGLENRNKRLPETSEKLTELYKTELKLLGRLALNGNLDFDENELRYHNVELSGFGFQSGYVHTKPDKFENATFAAKTDKMFSVHINRFQTVSLSTLKRCLSPRTLARQSPRALVNLFQRKA